MEDELKRLINISNEICNTLNEANVGNCKDKKFLPKQMLHYDLLRFGIYLSDADKNISEDEKGCIKNYLGMQASGEELERMKRVDYPGDNFAKDHPYVLKIAVLADAGRKIPNDKYKNQKAQIILDTFTLFGQRIIAGHEVETDIAYIRLTEYIERQKQFMKEYGVYHVNSEKVVKVDTSIQVRKGEEFSVEEKLEELNALTGLCGYLA